ncbi:MAG: acyl-CoA dehydratase activase [Anaerolineales bacterium]
MSADTYRLGIDIGSTTAKIVMLNDVGQVKFSSYRRHNAETLVTLQSILREAMEKLGNARIEYLVTGSAGMGVAETYNLPFIQEVVASAEVIHQRHPEVRTLIDIGGEDAKIIFFDEQYRPDIRMNGSCAGGTGAFIDEMATLLNVPVSELDGLASRHTTVYPMASRCGVFAKTDLQNLLSRQVPKEDIAASVFHAVVLQTLATLARGRDVRPTILFSGGPFTFMPSLKDAFLEVLNLTDQDVVSAESPELLPALGAALAASGVPQARQACSIQDLIDALAVERAHAQSRTNRHGALFESPQHYQDWAEFQKTHRIERIAVADCADNDYFLGIDSGSTTTKVVLIDADGRVAFSHYANNGGNSIQAAQNGLNKIRQAFAGRGFSPRIARSVVTGYGEDLICAAFGMDEGIVETLAHFRAAKAFDPDVTFILDIGGQDMKAIFIKDGQIQNIEINEACSSGCGSFIESFARNMGYGVADFAGLACAAEAPYNLGTRCTVFMNSRVKQALREGAKINDISAGLAYSVIKNALHKVLKITNTDVLGEHVVVQGGTFRNQAVQKALEQLIGRPVVCHDLAELMGAYGAALTARDAWMGYGDQPSTFIGLEKVDELGEYRRHDIRCRGCENKCVVTKLGFPNGNSFFSGNRCEKIYTNGGKAERKGVSVPALKYALLFDREKQSTDYADDADLNKKSVKSVSYPTGTVSVDKKLTIGIPRVLNMFENYPFWHALLTECGLRVRLSAPSSNTLYQGGAAHIMSENLCYPGKLVSGHIMDLVQAGVDRIFYPMVFYEKPEFTDANNTYNCPVVSGYPDVVRSAIDPQRKYGIPLDMPAISFRDDNLLDKACTKYLRGLGIKPSVIKKALQKAREAQAEFKAQIIEMGAEVIRDSEADGRPLILLMGRPYHIDPLINHNVPELLTDFGVDVLTEDCIPMTGETLANRHVMTQWEYINRYFHVARWVGQHDNVELVQLNSFGCGPDPFILDEVRAILAEYGKRPTVIRIDEIESAGSTKLRLRSMMESLRQADAHSTRVRISRKTVKPYQAEDRVRTLIVPDFSQFCSPAIVRPFIDLGYQIVQLPEPNHASVDVGLKYTNNEICYPGIITLGDLVKALQSGNYDLSRTAIGFSQTGGQCRATSYPSMIKKALVAAGFENVPVVTLSTSLSALNDQPGFKFDTKIYIYKAAIGMMFNDALSDMYHSTIIREKRKGETQAVADKYLNWFMDGTIRLAPTPLLKWLERAVQDFNAIETTPEHHPRVGIVGEIYVKYNAFSNNHVAQWLMDQGLEVVMPSFFEFFDGGLVSKDHAVKTLVKNRDVDWLVNTLGQKLAHHFLHQFDAVMQGYRRYHPHTSIRDIAANAQEILSLNHQYGEGWLIAGEVASFARNGVTNVLCLQPFGCIANHVIAKGVQKRLQEKYPQLNLLFLDADAGVSEVNFFNRMHFFVNHARTAADGLERRAAAGVAV